MIVDIAIIVMAAAIAASCLIEVTRNARSRVRHERRMDELVSLVTVIAAEVRHNSRAEPDAVAASVAQVREVLLASVDRTPTSTTEEST